MADFKPPPMIFAGIILLVLLFLIWAGGNWFWTSVVEGLGLDIGG